LLIERIEMKDLFNRLPNRIEFIRDLLREMV